MEKTESFILLFLSDFKLNREKSALQEEIEYQYQNSGKKYCGSQTNDAPVKYLLSAAHEDGADICKILCITSKDVYGKKNPIIGCTAYQRFKKMVKDYAEEENLRIPEVVPIFYDFQSIQGDVVDICEKERAGFLYGQIADAVHIMEHPSVYIDYTGGMRDISFFMTGIIKYLEFDSVNCKKIIYSNLQTTVIYNINYIYDMFQLVSGVEEFVTTGNARQLGLLFGQKKDSPIHDVLWAIINFSNSISLCWSASIDGDIRKISTSLDELEKNYQKEEDIFYTMFCTLIPSIREKMLLDKIVNGNQIEYPFLIQWCIDNGLIQQAITLYVEKMPYYYFTHHEIPDVVEVHEEKRKLGGDKYAETFYTDLFEHYYLESDELKKQMDEFKTIVRRIKDDCSDEPGLYMEKIEGEKNSNKKYKKELDKLKNFIKVKYIYKKKCSIYSIEIHETSTEKFLNRLCSGMIEYAHYFLVGDKNKFEDYRAAVKGTYKKKICALAYLKENGDRKLFERMKYYLAVKLLRNRINHASEKDMTESDDPKQKKDESGAVEYLGGEGVVVSCNYEKVVQLLRASNAINLLDKK